MKILKMKTIIDVLSLKKNSLFLAVFFIFSSGITKANAPVMNSWNLWADNNRMEARKQLEKITNQNPEAFLYLAFIDWAENKKDLAFKHFTQFYYASPNPYPYLYALISTPLIFENKILTQEKLIFFEKIYNDPKLDGTLKAMIAQDLGEHYMLSKNMKKAEEWYAKTGAIDKWQILCAFDNTSGGGFDKDWGALTKPKPTEKFINQLGAEISWYVPKQKRADRWVDFNFYTVLNSTVVYAQSFVESPIDQDVYLRVGTSGSLKVWVNDALTMNIEEERNCDMDIYINKINLKKGANRLLVQLGQSDIQQLNFLLRLTDDQANPVSGLNVSDQYRDYTIETASNSKNELLPLFAEAYFMDAIHKDTSDPLNYMLLAETYLRNDKSFEATNLLKKMEKKYPKSTFIHTRLMEAYLRARNRIDFNKEIETMKQMDSTAFVVLQYKMDEAKDEENYEKAWSILEEIEKTYGKSLEIMISRVDLAAYLNKYDELFAEADELYKKYPYNADAVAYQCAVQKYVMNNKKKALDVLNKFYKNYFNNTIYNQLYSIYLEDGNNKKAIEVLKEKIACSPYSYGYISDYANTLLNQQKYREALMLSDEMLAFNPYLSYTYQFKGSIYSAMKQDELAKENYQKAIYYGKTAYEAREQLRLLERKKTIFDIFPKNNLDSLMAVAPASTVYPESNALVLLNDYKMVFYPEGATEHNYDIAVKMFNASAIEAWKEYSIYFNPNFQTLELLKYEVIKPNGQKIRAEADQETVVFTNLEVGDVLHLEYRLKDLGTGPLSNYFSDQSLMQYAIPSMLNKCAILLPKDKKFQYTVNGATIQPVVTSIENMELYEWSMSNTLPIKDEPLMPNYVDVAPVLTYSAFPDWKFIGEWYRDLTFNRFSVQTDYVFSSTIKEILNGNENASQLEKAALFYQYILKNVTYSNVPFRQSSHIPQKPSKTITTRLGDCKDVATLFVAMCRAENITANLVLLDSKENGINHMLLPSPDFDHCIAQLVIDNKTYYIELTNNKLPFAAIGDFELNSNILPIPYKDEPMNIALTTLKTPYRDTNALIRTKTVVFNDKDMQVALHTKRTGAEAASMRYAYADLGMEDRLKYITQSIAADYTVPVKVSNLLFRDLDNLSDSLIIEYEVEIKNVLQEVAGMSIFDMPWTDKVVSLNSFTEEARKYPLQLSNYVNVDMEEEEIILIIPKGKILSEEPENIRFDCSNASYTLTFRREGKDKLIAKRTFIRKTDVITPADYPSFRKFIYEVSENDNKKYAFTKAK